MKRKTIDVDDEVYAAMKAESERRLETPNTVIRRLLGMEMAPSLNTSMKWMLAEKVDMEVSERMSTSISMSRSIPRLEESRIRRHPASALPLPHLPHHIPATLEHTLQMIHLVRNEGYTRIDATKALAEWHRVAIPTITIKFTRLLGISAHEIDTLLEPERHSDLETLLKSHFPGYAEVIWGTLRLP